MHVRVSNALRQIKMFYLGGSTCVLLFVKLIHSYVQGGTRGTAFISYQGFPADVKGTTWRGLSHAADWVGMQALNDAI